MKTIPQPLEKFIPQNLTVKADDLAHIFTEEDCHALWAAHAAGRPLLVRGKPGSGKSQMARAIAEQLGWAFVEEVIRGNTELDDLHWHFDAIGRLGEAQVRSLPGGSQAEIGVGKKPQCAENENTLPPLDPMNFLSPGAFWWAYQWKTADAQYLRCRTRMRPKPRLPQSKSDWKSEQNGVVLLLDEIDKAEPDLPNGLLQTLGNYQFTVPYLDDRQGQNLTGNPIEADPSRLLIIITTNEERELPQAFVRRCFVHTLTMGNDTSWFIERGRLHFGAKIDHTVYEEAAEMLLEDRRDNPHGLYPPGLAEYIDLLRALAQLPLDEQQKRLKTIREYALQKELKALSDS